MPSEQAKQVIWIASYPKSGNSWLQTVIRTAGRRFGFGVEDLDVDKLKREGRQPDVVGGISERVVSGPTTVLKTHATFPMRGPVHPELRLKPVGFVYVRRNPLDMLLSYINYTRLAYPRNQASEPYRQSLFVDLLGYEKAVPSDEWEKTSLDDIPRRHLDHALERFTELGTLIPGVNAGGSSWLQHCLSWRKAVARMPSVELRYEDLLEGPESFLPLQQLFRFTDADILRAATVVDQGLRALQSKNVFYNKMTSYYFPQYFSADRVQTFLDRFDAPLQTLGYGDLRSVVDR